MNTKLAKRIGLQDVLETWAAGVFTAAELADEESLREAVMEALENRLQYSTEYPPYGIRTDGQIRAYEEGLAEGLRLVVSEWKRGKAGVEVGRGNGVVKQDAQLVLF